MVVLGALAALILTSKGWPNVRDTFLDWQAFKDAFAVPAEFTPIGALTVGYRAEDKRSPSLRRGHRRLDDVVHHGRWAR